VIGGAEENINEHRSL
nr:RecName: Full=Snake venom serine protease IVa; Short=SVSP; AltName: Full=Basic proteinase IVa [Cerastes cerastes]